MKKLRLLLMATVLVVSVTALSSCAALDGVLLFGEDAFDAIFGFVDKGPLGALYDGLNIESLITGEHGGNFENPDENPGDDTETTVKVESLAVDCSGAKTVFKFAEKFSICGFRSGWEIGKDQIE